MRGYSRVYVPTEDDAHDFTKWLCANHRTWASTYERAAGDGCYVVNGSMLLEIFLDQMDRYRIRRTTVDGMGALVWLTWVRVTHGRCRHRRAVAVPVRFDAIGRLGFEGAFLEAVAVARVEAKSQKCRQCLTLDEPADVDSRNNT